MVSIKDIIVKNTENLTSKIEFRDGIIIELRYVSRSVISKMSRECTVMKYDPKSRVREPQIDGKKFSEVFTRAAVVGWEGVTPRSIATLIAVDLSKIKPEDLDKPLPFTAEDFAFIMENAYELDNWLQNEAVEIRNFKPSKEDEEKNSQSSQSGS